MTQIGTVFVGANISILASVVSLDFVFTLAYIGLLIVAAVVAARSPTRSLPRWLKWSVILSTIIYSALLIYYFQTHLLR